MNFPALMFSIDVSENTFFFVLFIFHVCDDTLTVSAIDDIFFIPLFSMPSFHNNNAVKFTGNTSTIESSKRFQSIENSSHRHHWQDIQ